MVIYQHDSNFLTNICLRTLIYNGINYGTMEKTMALWKKTKPKTQELWFTMDKLWYYSKL